MTSASDGDKNHLETMLRARDIKPTAVRLLVLRAMVASSAAFSLQDIEDALVTVDKSTVYRCITLFLTHHLIHAIDDGTGVFKYAVCRADCHCGEDDGLHLDDLHAHFYCTRCRRTFCLSRIHVPVVALPQGFAVRDINYVLKGTCPSCSHTDANRQITPTR